jgi:hypothetical protein
VQKRRVPDRPADQFRTAASNIHLWALNIELPSRHLSAAHNFEFALLFLENVCTYALY